MVYFLAKNKWKLIVGGILLIALITGIIFFAVTYEPPVPPEPIPDTHTTLQVDFVDENGLRQALSEWTPLDITMEVTTPLSTLFYSSSVSHSKTILDYDFSFENRTYNKIALYKDNGFAYLQLVPENTWLNSLRDSVTETFSVTWEEFVKDPSTYITADSTYFYDNLPLIENGAILYRADASNFSTSSKDHLYNTGTEESYISTLGLSSDDFIFSSSDNALKYESDSLSVVVYFNGTNIERLEITKSSLNYPDFVTKIVVTPAFSDFDIPNIENAKDVESDKLNIFYTQAMLSNTFVSSKETNEGEAAE